MKDMDNVEEEEEKERALLWCRGVVTRDDGIVNAAA